MPVSAILVPVVASEPLEVVDLEASIADLRVLKSEIVAAIGASASAPLFSAPLADSAVVYWVSRFTDDINERAVKFARIHDIRGDAAIVFHTDNPSGLDLPTLKARIERGHRRPRRAAGAAAPHPSPSSQHRSCRCTAGTGGASPADGRLPTGAPRERAEAPSGGSLGTPSGTPWRPARAHEGKHEKASHRLSPSPEPPANKRHELCPVCGDGTDAPGASPARTSLRPTPDATPGTPALSRGPPGAAPWRPPAAARALDFSAGPPAVSQAQNSGDSPTSQRGLAEGVPPGAAPSQLPLVPGEGGASEDLGGLGCVHRGYTLQQDVEREGARLGYTYGDTASTGASTPWNAADTGSGCAANTGCGGSAVEAGGARGQVTGGVSQGQVGGGRVCEGVVESGTPREAPWDELPTDSLLHVFSSLSFLDLHACVRVSRRWRQAILEDEELLANAPIDRKAKPLPSASDLKPQPISSSPSSSSSWLSSFSFSSTSSSSSLSSSDSSSSSSSSLSPPHSFGPPSAARLQWMHPSLRFKICYRHIPVLLTQAAEAGNVAAMVWCADLLEAQGGGGAHQRKALEWRKKAARRGHQTCQYLVGMAYYRGDGELMRDGEEALSWLLRCVKNPDNDPHISAAAALLLGYMYLDGEGTERADVSEAIKWLTLARDNGSREAEETVGWLWNTGQY